MNIVEESFWFLGGFLVALLIIFGMYVFISYQGYQLAKEIGNEYAWVSFIPALQLFVFVLLYKETQDKFTTRELMLLFIGVPFVLNFVMNMGIGNVVLSVIYGFVSVVLLLWLVVHVVKGYTPRSSSSSYAVLSLFLSNIGIAIWSLRHREEIAKVYIAKTKKEGGITDSFDISNEEKVSLDGEVDVSSFESVEITEEIREEMFKDTGTSTSKDVGSDNSIKDVDPDTGNIKENDEESRNKVD